MSLAAAIGRAAMPDLDAALEPIAIGGREARNRVVCSPISTNMAEADGRVTDDVVDFYSTMGKAGVGMVTIGGTSVSPEGGVAANGMRIGPDRLNPGLRRLAHAVRETGALCSLQVFHVGAQGNTAYTGQPVFGPSPYVCPDIGIEATSLTEEGIERIEDDFAKAIHTALDCGFDFVELHFGHGYLLHEFLSPVFNRRKDRFGGGPRKRLRIVRDILDRIEAQVPEAAGRLGARISGNDFQKNGLTIARNRDLVGMLDDFGMAYWSVTAGVYETARLKYVHMNKGDYWRYAGKLRAMTKTPVIAQGGIRTLAQGAAILRDGLGDLFGMAQALIADPNLIHKTLDGRADAVDPCIECSRCRYVKRKDLTFDCVLPEAYHPPKMRNLKRRMRRKVAKT